VDGWRSADVRPSGCILKIERVDTHGEYICVCVCDSKRAEGASASGNDSGGGGREPTFTHTFTTSPMK